MAVRYDQKTKDEVVAFIADYNAKNGRGGQSKAAEKYKVTQLTISKWLKNAGVKKGGKKSKAPASAPAPVAVVAPAKKRRGRGPGKKAKAIPTVVSKPTSSSNQVLDKLVKIRQQIEELQVQFDALKGQL